MSKFFILSLILLSTGLAQAAGDKSGILLGVNLFMYNAKVTDNGTSGESNTMIYDAKLGYLPGSGLYVGGIYTSRNHSGTLSDSGSATGASLGYMGDNGLYLMGHYLVTAKTGDYTDGSGYQADFGYLANVSGSFHVGAELTYRDITYKKLNGADTTHEVTEMFPMLSAIFIF